MKRLIIVRHAKAEQGGYDHDFMRQLSEKGRDDALSIALDLKRRNIFPDYIISSPAARALTTARIFAGELDFPEQNINEQKGLYFDFSTQDFVDMIHGVPDQCDTLFVFGHNPFIYFVAENMSHNFSGDMPTCSTVILDFNTTSWKKVEPRKGQLLLHLYPKLYS
jgi:phosphohistidine phosphatase